MAEGSSIVGSCIRARRRHWLVESDSPVGRDPEALNVVCIDDDAQGQTQTIIPSCEVDFKLIDDEAWENLGNEAPADPKSFSLYLQNLQWNTATSADQRLFQAPFRAGIELSPYQLVPLAKALDLPRVNLMIADDVGLGKTIEAALVMRELMLRRRLDFFVVAAPASMTIQWQEELASKFGISAVIVDREFFADIRAKRGFAYNPWNAATGFIISHTLLRDAAYTDGLVAILGDLRARSMLILDEAHHIAPSHGELYGVDTQLTRAARDLGRRFEHRLFLTATPHNGHSNSFSALLEILDPQRFMRGIDVSRAEHDQVIVRRLKSDLRELTNTPFAKRVVEAVRLTHAVADCPELVLSGAVEKFFEEGTVPHRSQIRLQQRLMSCVHSFCLTLEKEMESFSSDDRDKAGAILREAGKIRFKPDQKTLALIEWIKSHLGSGGVWNGRRLIVFSEFETTLVWLKKQLLQALRLEDDSQRILEFTGATSIEDRASIKAKFNSDPEAEEVRILLCTDAAREGINLQHRCYDLFHYDLPWNPSRLEQRNGRIDRRLQPMPQVFCRYFVYENRNGDRILDALMRKTERINLELGEVGPVIANTIEEKLQASGLWGREADKLRQELDSKEWLERQRQDEEARLSPEQEQRRRKLAQELDAVTRRLEQSRRQKAVSPDVLQGVFVEAVERLVPSGVVKLDYGQHDVFEIKAKLDGFRGGNWAPIFDDMMMRPKAKGETDAEYREKVPLKRISFHTIKDGERLDTSVEQLHLEHRLVKRLLAQFEAQGFRSRLERTAVLQSSGSLARCILLGRLSLYAKGAASLHSEIVPITATLSAKAVTPLKDEGRTAREVLKELADAVDGADIAPADVQAEFRGRAKSDAEALRPLLTERAEAIEGKAREELASIGEEHAVSLERLLKGQKDTLLREIAKPSLQVQLSLDLDPEGAEQRRQDEDYWRQRLGVIDIEIEQQPELIRRAYQINARRLEPVGLVYLLPAQSTKG
jgi:ERCC4-related helicase